MSRARKAQRRDSENKRPSTFRRYSRFARISGNSAPREARVERADAGAHAIVRRQAALAGDDHLVVRRRAAVDRCVAERGRVVSSGAISDLVTAAILSLAVSQQTQEIGIRVALGAKRWGIAREVATRAVVQIGIGVLLGLPFAGALSYEFLEVTGSGGSVPGAVAMASVLGLSVMLLVSLAACTVPTLRALRVAPMDALRKEG
jgi:hypothetical protein